LYPIQTGFHVWSHTSSCDRWLRNSIRHGIAPRLGNGMVSILAQKDRDQLIIKVCDDGLGKQSRPDSKNGDHDGIGLKNIDRRLTELYGVLGRLELVGRRQVGVRRF
jgi:LytS/YehU family sensor histidine kinase